MGVGSSAGVPVIGCKCNICNSNNIKNNRKRSSVLFRDGTSNVIIDFGADIRTQLLENSVTTLDGAILTHDHADHVNGIDDLKTFVFYNKKPVNLYSEAHVVNSVMKRFSWMFKSPDAHDYWGNERLKENIVELHKKYIIGNYEFLFFPQHHGQIDSFGVKYKNFVYANDLVKFPKESEQYLYDLDYFVIDCISYKSTFGHSGLDQVLEWVKQFKPKKTILTNLSHEICFHEIKKYLPDNCEPGYDGMIIKY